MAGTLTDYAEGEEKVQTTNWRKSGGESRSGMHNPKVAGSSPAPATNKDHVKTWSLCISSARFAASSAPLRKAKREPVKDSLFCLVFLQRNYKLPIAIWCGVDTR